MFVRIILWYASRLTHSVLALDTQFKKVLLELLGKFSRSLWHHIIKFETSFGISAHSKIELCLFTGCHDWTRIMILFDCKPNLCPTSILLAFFDRRLDRVIRNACSKVKLRIERHRLIHVWELPFLVLRFVFEHVEDMVEARLSQQGVDCFNVGTCQEVWHSYHWRGRLCNGRAVDATRWLSPLL